MTIEDVVKEWKKFKPCIVGSTSNYALEYLNRIESIVDKQKIFSGGGGGGFIPGGDEGAHYQMPERQYSDFISDRKATIESFLASCGSRAVGLEVTIRNSDGTHITAKFD